MRQKAIFFKLYLIAMALMALGPWIMCFSRCSLHLLPYFTLVHRCENYSLTVGSLNSPVVRPESVSVIIGAGQHEMRHANDRNNHEQVLKVTLVVYSFITAHSFLCHYLPLNKWSQYDCRQKKAAGFSKVRMHNSHFYYWCISYSF